MPPGRRTPRLSPAAGIGKVSVRTASYGENQPMVNTEDGAAEPKNRRVEIKFAR